MTELRITVTNTSNAGGTFLTPVYFGFHDGNFDLFDVGEAASPGLEALAEDGSFGAIAAERQAVSPDSQGLVVAGDGGPIATQESTSNTLVVDANTNTYVSFGAMILPSNDAFIGTDNAVRLFDDHGNFLGAQTLTFTGSDVYDAGTEVNTEEDAAFLNQTAPNTGVDENGVITQHPGFNGSQGNPIGEGDQNILGGTNAFGEFIDPVEADFTRDGAPIAEVHINTVERFSGDMQRDILFGSAADDIAEGNGGEDLLIGNDGYDVLYGGGSHDILLGGSGNDNLFGGNGRDTLIGGEDNDYLSGGIARDQLAGGEGNDTLEGGAGRDFLYGGEGNDIIVGGKGADVLYGGSGADLFVFSAGDGQDTAFGLSYEDAALFIGTELDDFHDLLANAHDTADGVVINYGGGSSVLIAGVSESELSADNFLFG